VRIVADTERVARIKALIEELRQLSKELTEEELEQVAGGSVHLSIDPLPDQDDNGLGPLCATVVF
jgi:bacteriocin-like protein